MLLFILKWGVSLPVYVTLQALADGPQSWGVRLCFGFTSFLLADLAVSIWMQRREPVKGA